MFYLEGSSTLGFFVIKHTREAEGVIITGVITESDKTCLEPILKKYNDMDFTVFPGNLFRCFALLMLESFSNA